MDLQSEFGRRVRELRLRQGLTQKQLAQNCGGKFATQRVGEIERGHTNVTLTTVAGLCKGLRCEPLELFLFDAKATDKLPTLPNRRLMDRWNAADDATKGKMLRVLAELL